MSGARRLLADPVTTCRIVRAKRDAPTAAVMIVGVVSVPAAAFEGLGWLRLAL